MPTFSAPFRLVGAWPSCGAGCQPAAVCQTAHLAFRYFHPPIPATVHLEGARPARIVATAIHGRVVSASGPWRTSGEWWTSGPWDRDEWDVALNDGAFYRLYHADQWFIEGSYD